MQGKRALTVREEDNHGEGVSEEEFANGSENQEGESHEEDAAVMGKSVVTSSVKFSTHMMALPRFPGGLCVLLKPINIIDSGVSPRRNPTSAL